MPKRILPLSESEVETAEPKDKDYKLSDGFGLHLLVTSSGGKFWRYQYKFSGKQKLLALGVYPKVSLADAREKRDEARKQLADGLDPSQLKKQQKNPEWNSFQVVAREWHERYKSQWSERHAGDLLTRLQHDVFPFIGNMAMTEIKAVDLLAVLRRIEKRTSETAQRIKTAFGQIFRYAVEAGRATHDPTETLRGALTASEDKHFTPSTDSKGVASLLVAIDGFEGSSVVKCAMQLVPLLLVEPADLCHAEWEEIDFQAEQWNVPAEKTDLTQVHIVPLARQSIEILRRLSSATGHSRYVFPSLRSSLRCMSVNSIYAAMACMGFENDEIDGKRFSQVARSALSEGATVSTDILEFQLSRRTKVPNETVYDPMQFLPQRRGIMQKWADYLNDLKKGGGDAARAHGGVSPEERCPAKK